MPEAGAGVMEIRLHGGIEFRVFYVARFEEAVYVLHAFGLGKARYAALLEARKGRT
jgi:putative component of toxin-antitoxin plasmid stabilization module